MSGTKCRRCGCPCDGEMCGYCMIVQKEIEKREAEHMAKAGQGLVCPKCDCERMPVYYTRKRSGRVMRVRVCDNCGSKVTTYERIG